MTREEKIKALEEKLWNEIAEEKVDLTKVLNYSLEINSPQEFNHAAMNLASFALLEEALFCKCMFRSAASVIDSDIKYIVDEDTLDILLNKEHILIPIEEEYDIHTDWSDEWWQYNSISICEKIAYDRKKREESENN